MTEPPPALARPIRADRTPFAPPAARPVGPSTRDSLVDLLWVVLPLMAWLVVVEPGFAHFVLCLDPHLPVPFRVLVGMMMIRMVLAGALIWWRLHRRRQPARLIGWTTHNGLIELLVGIPAVLALLVVPAAMSLWLIMFWPDAFSQIAQTQRTAIQNFPVMTLSQRLVLVALVACVEELVFRGLLLHRLTVICRHAWLAITIQAAFFGLAHLYEGPFAMLIIFYLGLILGSLTWWRRSLLPAIVSHALFNAVQFTILEHLIRPNM